MVYVDVLFNLKNGERKQETKQLCNKICALRFMYNIRRKKHTVLGWKCDYPEDNEYLSKRFHLSTRWKKEGKL